MIPLAIMLLMAGYVLLYVGFKGDGAGGYNPATYVTKAFGGLA